MLRAILKQNGATVETRYYDMITPEREEFEPEQSAEDIISNIKKKLGGE